MNDAVSFLWRWELAGHPRDAEAWRMMHDFANSAFPRAGAAFSDMHIALAQTVAGNDAALEARARQMDELARKGRYPSGFCIPAVSHAFAAFERRECRTMGEDNRLSTHARVRAFLENAAKRQIPITYQELAKALQILPPHSIHQVTEILEHLMEEDAAADRPFIAALAISKARGGLPAAGFFQCARRLGRFAGDPHGQDAWSFHAAELNAVFARWGGSRDN